MLGLLLVLVLATVVSIVVFFGSAWLERGDKGSESWRDRPPLWFNMFLPFINMFNLIRTPDKTSPAYDLLSRRLKTSGFDYAIKPEELSASRWIALILGSSLVLLILKTLSPEKASYLLLTFMILPLTFFYPDIWLNDAIKLRQLKISKQFPFFLELLVLSMRAGLSFSSALEHATIKLPDGSLKAELQHLVRDTRTGLSRKEALDLMAKRVAMPEMSNFVAAINQAEEVGGELGDLLYKQAIQRRTERFLRAEEMANKAPVKMLGPLIGILFPMTFVIIGFVIFIKARDGGALGFLTGN